MYHSERRLSWILKTCRHLKADGIMRDTSTKAVPCLSTVDEGVSSV